MKSLENKQQGNTPLTAKTRIRLPLGVPSSSQRSSLVASVLEDSKKFSNQPELPGFALNWREKGVNSPNRECTVCGTAFYCKPSQIARGRGKVCSVPCKSKAQGALNATRTGDSNPNWKGGVSKDHMRYKLRFQARYPHKARVHAITKNAIRSGKLVPAPCETCGSMKRIAAHHDNYRKPLSVRWLCQPCHNRHHAKLRAM